MKVQALFRVWMTMICFLFLSQSVALAAPNPKVVQSFFRVLFWGGKAVALQQKGVMEEGMEKEQPWEAQSWEEILQWPTIPEIAISFTIFGTIVGMGLFCELCTRIGLRRLLRDPKYRTALAITQAPLIPSANITDFTEPSAVGGQQQVKPIESAIEGGVQYLMENGIAREAAEWQLGQLISHRRKQTSDSTEGPIIGLNPFEGHIEYAGVYAACSVCCLCLMIAVFRIGPSMPGFRHTVLKQPGGQRNAVQQLPQVVPVVPRTVPVEQGPHSITQGPESTPPSTIQLTSPVIHAIRPAPAKSDGIRERGGDPNNSTSVEPKARLHESISSPISDLIDLLRAAPGTVRDGATKSRDAIREGLGGSPKHSK